MKTRAPKNIKLYAVVDLPTGHIACAFMDEEDAINEKSGNPEYAIFEYNCYIVNEEQATDYGKMIFNQMNAAI